ncbi:hypothetical protein BCV71DRAFT_282301 [Rhizopus microsporus]|uniref:Ndc10 domain-containing protein n=1 Tax=Rhizopus microsporus TaxID=58291 RepID=A0A1X0RJX5_RHIZD|nr:hypothetical protein BCV71DRAFT_282301 [Rhizopus microsporus]
MLFKHRNSALNKDFGDGEIVTGPKLGYFLAEYVMKRGRKLRRSPDGTPIILGREWPLVRTFPDTLEKEKVKSKRQNFEDRGKNTLNDDYTKQETKKVNGYLLTEKNDNLGCRDRLCFLISHAMLCRSQTALGMQFADLFPLVLENQGISE